MVSRTIITFVVLLTLVVTATDSQGSSGATAQYNVKSYGAVGNGVTDDTAAFQNAINAAFNAGGAVVFAPKGTYRIAGVLTIRNYVTLEGVWASPATWQEGKGTVLLAESGHGNEDGEPFILTWGSNCTLRGITIYYPNQVKDGSVPVPYPWTIQHRFGDNMSVVDVNIVNPYKAVEFAPGGRHYIRNLHGHPISKGVFIDYCLDVGRIENVHFSSEGFYGPEMTNWIRQNGTAFTFGRTDWQYVLNTYCYGYKTGYHFIRTSDGASNGNYMGIGAASCRHPVLVDDVTRFGTLIANGEFSAAGDTDTASVTVNSTNGGPVTFLNCSFGGDPDRIADIRGTGWVSFNGCNFLNWDRDDAGKYAILSRSGRLTVTGCQFYKSSLKRGHVEILSGTTNAIVTGNQSMGSFVVQNNIGNKAGIGFNVGGYYLPQPTTPRVNDGGPFSTNNSSISASWTADSPQNPIIDFRYRMGSTPGGSELVDWTSTGEEESVTRTGLALSPGSTYHVSVFGIGEDGQPSEIGISDGVTIVSAVGTPGDVKENANGTLAGITGVVTANTDIITRTLFVQSPDRSGAIRVWLQAGQPNVPVGSRVKVQGTLSELQGERLLTNAQAQITDSEMDQIKPLFMPVRSVGGPDLNALTRGVTTGYGLYNTAMLVQVFGRVTHVDTTNWLFYVEDGSGIPFDPNPGLAVNYRTTVSVLTPPEVGQYVLLTGISGIRTVDGIRYPLLRLRYQSDIQTMN